MARKSATATATRGKKSSPAAGKTAAAGVAVEPLPDGKAEATRVKAKPVANKGRRAADKGKAADATTKEAEGFTPDEAASTDRRGASSREERRGVGERRRRRVPVAVDRRRQERRDGERRRQIDPTTCEREYADDELDFMTAIEDYKTHFRRPFPTWSEILEVLKAMGYRRVADPTEIVPNRAKAVDPAAADEDEE